MAQQANQYYQGRMGTTIFYKLNEGYFIRSVPPQVQQTAATKKRDDNFAIASRAGRMLRCLLLPVLPFNKDKKMQNDFAGAIMKWLQINTIQQIAPAAGLPFIQNFQFNHNFSLTEKCKIKWAVTPVNDGLLNLHLPAFVPKNRIAAPADTTLVECAITAASCDLRSGEENGSFTSLLHIPYTDTQIPAQTKLLPVAMPPGSLVVVAVALRYISGNNTGLTPANDTSLFPAAVIEALYV